LSNRARAMSKKNGVGPATDTAKSVAKKSPTKKVDTVKSVAPRAAVTAMGGTRIERLHWMRRRALDQHYAAADAESFIAARQFLQDVAKLDSDIANEERALQAAAALDAAAADEERFRALLVEQASEMHVSHLEVFVKAYLDRHPGLRLEGGVDR
jgi:hypothetical protein